MNALSMLLALVAMAGEPIKIGVYGTFSGPVGEALGKDGRNGAILAMEEINAAGGVLGRKIELVIRDDQLNPPKAVADVKDLVDNEKVVALVGPQTTGVAEATTAITNAKKIPHIITDASSCRVNDLFSEFPENFVFRMGYSEVLQGTAMVQRAVEVRKFTKVALIHDISPHGQGGKKRIERAMELRGKKLVSVGTVNPKELDFSAQVKAAKDAGAEAVFIFTYGPEAIKIMKALEAIHWKPEVICAYASLTGRFDKSMNGVWGSSVFIEEYPKTETSKKFFPAYKKRFAVSKIVSSGSAQTQYDAVHLLARAIVQAGTTDGLRLKDALENLKSPYVGSITTYTKPWSPNDHEAMKRQNVIWGYVKDGLLVPE